MPEIAEEWSSVQDENTELDRSSGKDLERWDSDEDQNKDIDIGSDEEDAEIEVLVGEERDAQKWTDPNLILRDNGQVVGTGNENITSLQGGDAGSPMIRRFKDARRYRRELNAQMKSAVPVIGQIRGGISSDSEEREKQPEEKECPSAGEANKSESDIQPCLQATGKEEGSTPRTDDFGK